MSQPSTAATPSVLIVYYSYTQQTRRVAEEMAGVFRGRGCAVDLAAIEFTDPRYVKRFKEFPMPRPFLEVVAMTPPNCVAARPRSASTDIVTEQNYDLVCIGSPTWWLSTERPDPVVPRVRRRTPGADGHGLSPLPSVAAGTGVTTSRPCAGSGPRAARIFADGIHFRYQGGQLRSLLSLLSYLGSGEYRNRYLGVKIPPTNLQTTTWTRHGHSRTGWRTSFWPAAKAPMPKGKRV